jgi:hypothetical protein
MHKVVEAVSLPTKASTMSDGFASRAPVVLIPWDPNGELPADGTWTMSRAGDNYNGGEILACTGL